MHLLVTWLAVQVALGDGGTADKSDIQSAEDAGRWRSRPGTTLGDRTRACQLGELADRRGNLRHWYVSSARRWLLQWAINVGEAALFGLLAFSSGSSCTGNVAMAPIV